MTGSASRSCGCSCGSTARSGRTRSSPTTCCTSRLEALQGLTRFQPLAAGDLVLTGTPGGTALKAPPKPIEIIGALLPPATKWKAFFKAQARNTSYLADGDVVEIQVATADGKLDLGRQRGHLWSGTR